MNQTDPRIASTAAAGVDVVARHRQLLRRTALVSALTLASRIVGFFRETLAASIFGDHSLVNDAFVTAWRVPNLFRSLLGEGAMSASMQTAITRADAERGEVSGRRLFQSILRVVGWLALSVCLAGMAIVTFLPETMPGTGWRWLGGDPEAVRELTVRMLPFVVFVCLSAVCGGALQVRGHFASPALAPVVMNLGWIAALFLVAERHGWLPIGADAAAEYARQLAMARMLAWYALVAGALLLAVQVPALVRERLLARAPAHTDPGSREVERREVVSILKASLPLALGAAVYQVNVLVDGWMAIGLLPTGGASLLYYATRLQQFPMALVSMAATSAVFPALTALGQRRDLVALRALHDRTHLAIAFVALPASLGLFLFAEPIVAVCFQHGAFGVEGVERASLGLRALAFAILPAGAAGLVARTYYALGDFRTPVVVSIAMVVLNVLLNLLFVVVLGMDLEGLALATAVCSWGNLIGLWPGLRRELALPASELLLSRRLARQVLAATSSTGIAFALHVEIGARLARAPALAFAIGIALTLYLALADALGIPEWQHLRRRLLRRDRPPRDVPPMRNS